MGKYDLDIEKYRKALEKVIQRFSDRGWEEIKLEEVWFETSIPIDILLEVFNAGVNIPAEVKLITHKGNIVWKSEE
ncbi:MAG: hypothetical protein ABDH59_09485 [Fervidobacterium sp.]